MNVFESALLGLIQGFCEFLPISSSGHLLLARLLLGIQTDTPAMKMLDILLHVGTLIPVIVIFWKDWIKMICHPIKDKSFIMLIFASVPALLIYIAAKILFDEVDGFDVFNSGWFLGASFLITALFLIICDFSSRSVLRRKTEVNLKSAVFMGLFQGIGMIPGISRSGSTITGGVLTGLRKDTAARFSFIMSAPAILGSLMMEGKDALEEGYINEIEIIPTLIGVLIACIAGFIAIRFMLKIIATVPMGYFALYLAVIGVAYLLLQFAGSNLLPPFAIPVGTP